jgi:hypothetical protein
MAIVGSVRAAVLAAIAGVAGAWACGSAGAFACADDSMCAGTAALGVCEPSGYCSFPDAECPSGRRYGARAPAELADACVEPSDPTSAGVTDDGAEASGDTTTDDSTTTASATSITTTTPVDPTSDGDAETVDGGPTTSDASASASSSSAGGDEQPSESTTNDEPEPEPCRPVFVDTFDGPAFDPEWGNWASAGCSFALVDGHLELSTGPSVDEWISEGLHTDVHSFEGGHTRAELVPFGPPLDVIGVWLSIYDDVSGCEVQIAAEAGRVMIMVDGAYFEGPALATDEPLWLQLRVDADDGVHWEYSTDGDTWLEAHAEPSPCDFTNARSALFAGGIHDQNSPIVRLVESYERCEAP